MGRDWKWSLGNNFVFISFYGRKFGLEIREMEPIKCREAEIKLEFKSQINIDIKISSTNLLIEHDAWQQTNVRKGRLKLVRRGSGGSWILRSYQGKQILKRITLKGKNLDFYL